MLPLLAATFACGPAPEEATYPGGVKHLVVVSLDTLRADHVACYGHPFVQTPTLDRMAAEGVRFSQCISTTSTTLSSHTSLFTGTYPHTHGVVKNAYAVHPDNRMLPEILGDAGFECAGFVGAAPLDATVGFSQGFDHFDDTYPGEAHQRRADDVTDTALRWLAQRAERAAPSDRLFLFVHYYDIHSPYTEPEPFAGMYRRKEVDVQGTQRGLREARKILGATGHASLPAGAPEGSVEEGFAERIEDAGGHPADVAEALVADYCAGVTYTDHHLGRLVDGLEELGLLQESLVLLTADHGETFHEHSNVFNHGTTVFDTEVHVPLILRFPDRRGAGRVVERLTSGIDVLPTLLSLLELPLPEGVEGEDVSPVLDGPMPPREPVFAEATKPNSQPRFNDDREWPNRRKFQCVRTERYKYMFRLPDEQFLLFDLEHDAGEQHNLLGDEGELHRERAEAFDRALRAWSATLTTDRKTGIVDSEKHQRSLDALGYGGEDDG